MYTNNSTANYNSQQDFYISVFNVTRKEFRNILANKKYTRKLAKILGSLDCVEFFKEIYFFCTAKSGGKIFEGNRYIYNSFKAWQNQLDDIRCDRTIQNYAKKLVEVGLIKIKRLRKSEFIQTNYYTVNFKKLFEIIDYGARETGKTKEPKKSSDNSSQNNTERYTVDIEGNIIARSNIDALEKTSFALDNENIAKTITKSLHSDLNTIKSPNIRDHLLRGDRGKLTQPVEEIDKNLEEDLNQHDLDNNQLSKQPLNELETGAIANQLENSNQTGWASLSEDLEAITETSIEMPGKDRSYGACNTDENKASHKDNVGSNVLTTNQDSNIIEAPIKINKPEAYQGQKLPHETGQGTNVLENKQKETTCQVREDDRGQVEKKLSHKKIVTKQQLKANNKNKLTPELRKSFIKQLNEQEVNTEDSKVIAFIDNQDPSKTQAGIEAVKNRGGGIDNRTSFFLSEAHKAKVEILGPRGIVYGAEQRERDRKLNEELMKPEAISKRANFLKQCQEKLQANLGKNRLFNNKQDPLAEARAEIEAEQENPYA